MNFLVRFVQVFASILTIIGFTGFFGVPEVIQGLGIEATQLQIIFFISLIIVVFSFVFGPKIMNPGVVGDKKSQIQIGGKKNKQKMS